MFNFVTFHAEVPDSVTLVPKHPKHALERGEVDYRVLLDFMGRSARLFHPDAKLTLLTDEGFQPEGDSYEIVRSPIRPDALMFDRAAAQLAYLRSRDMTQPVILLDSDILINRDLSGLLSEDFDVALTWRAGQIEPINGGFIVVNNRRPDAVIRFFERFLDVYRTDHAGKLTWFGDQVTLRDMLGIEEKGAELPPAQLHEGVKVSFLPCDIFNFTPNNGASPLVPPLVEKAVLHFKGPRKWMMRLYWRAYIAPKSGHPDDEAAGTVARDTLAQLVAEEDRIRSARAG